MSVATVFTCTSLPVGGRALIYTGDRIEVSTISGMSKADIRQPLDVIAEHAEELLALWQEYNGKEKFVPLTDTAFKAAADAGRQARNAPTAVMRPSVHPLHAGSSLGLSLELRNGAAVTIPVSEIRELAAQPPKELSKVKVDAFGEGLVWRSLDIAISAAGLLEDFFGCATRAKSARADGLARTPAKVDAARKKGAQRRSAILAEAVYSAGPANNTRFPSGSTTMKVLAPQGSFFSV